jgi:hypothetical protein
VVAGGLGGTTAAGWRDEAVAHGGVHRDDALQPAGRSERQMAVLGAIVEPLVRAVLETGSDLAPRRGVTPASLSPTIRFGGWSAFFNRRRSNRFAALRSRRGCRNSSSTAPFDGGLIHRIKP